MRDGLGPVGRFALVMLATVGALRALDRVPALLTGATHGTRLFETLDEAELALGVKLWLPSYYPDALSWPPARIEADRTAPLVAIRIEGRARGEEHAVICQSLEGDGCGESSFRQLLPRAEEVGAVQIDVGGRPASLKRLVTPGGGIVHDLFWVQGGRSLAMRYHGPAPDLLRMAASMGRAQR